ncbi:Hypothetical protein R9X50_00588500 [Acrodontium crateriforme]|uniref:Uncharacterized protein n=1 Tax=Acrodontium crateriforme TaxID=150365 RepID=A0AAQ3MAN9_9PEZI|nr:Hypothetical protein R9X50_00588500 [Acrodontium crateriforme]
MSVRKLYAAAAVVALSNATLLCKTQSQPNPIAADYPNDPTGTVNGTIAILPIPYSIARSIIPSEYPILTRAISSILPHLPADEYPAFLQLDIDHDVQASGISIPDFLQAKILFPFVDRLGDGYTSMMYGSQGLISADNLVAVVGSSVYGYVVTGGTFDPPCDAYGCVEGSEDCEEKYFNAYSALDILREQPKIGINFTTTDNSPYSLDVFKNITNQPQFSANKLLCDQFIRLFNSSVTMPPYAPQAIRAQVSAVAPFFAQTTSWSDVYGFQLDNAFIEHNLVQCDSLQGYQFTD